MDISYKSSKPSTYFMVEGADFDLFLLTGPTPKDVVRQFTALTGTADLPPVKLIKRFIMSMIFTVCSHKYSPLGFFL